MCLVCHQGLSDSDVENQLLEILNTKNFENTNVTSISHMSIAGFGLNGPLAQKRAIQLMEEYITWKQNNKSSSDNDFFGTPSADLVQEQLAEVHKFNEISIKNNLTKDDIKDMFYHNKSDNGKRVNELFGNLSDYSVEMTGSFNMSDYSVKENKTSMLSEFNHRVKSVFNMLCGFMDVILLRIKCLLKNRIESVKETNVYDDTHIPNDQ